MYMGSALTLSVLPHYSGREAPSLKMGSVCFSDYSLGVDFRSLCWLVRAPPISGEERNVGEWSVLCLPGLFVRTLISLTNAYAGCGRPTLNFAERFCLGWSVQPPSWTQRADVLNAVYFRRGLTCTPGLTNDLIDGGQPRAKPHLRKAKTNHVLETVFSPRLAIKLTSSKINCV